MQNQEAQKRPNEEKAEEVREVFPQLRLVEGTEGFEMTSSEFSGQRPLAEESEVDDLIPSKLIHRPRPIKPPGRWA